MFSHRNLQPTTPRADAAAAAPTRVVYLIVATRISPSRHASTPRRPSGFYPIPRENFWLFAGSRLSWVHVHHRILGCSRSGAVVNLRFSNFIFGFFFSVHFYIWFNFLITRNACTHTNATLTLPRICPLNTCSNKWKPTLHPWSNCNPVENSLEYA